MNKIIVMTVAASVATGVFAGWGDVGKAAVVMGARAAVNAAARSTDTNEKNGSERNDSANGAAENSARQNGTGARRGRPSAVAVSMTLAKDSEEAKQQFLARPNDETVKLLSEEGLADVLAGLPPVKPGTGSSYRYYVSKISNQELLKKIARATKDGHVRYDCLQKITDRKDFMAELFQKNNNKALAEFKANPVLGDERVAKKIHNTEIAEYLLEHGDFSGLKSRTEYIGGRGIEYSDSYQAAVIIKAIVQRLGDAKLNELAAEAKKRAEEKRSSTMVFGDFYLDMSTLDFFVLARVMRINPDWGYKTMTAEQDWKKRFVVSSFEFKAKDRASILDCEDSLVLQQVIHQCVKHKDGKATILDYVGEIDTDAKVEKTWDGRSLEVGVWTEYVNTKLDVKIRYNKKEGVLDFSHR